MAQLHGEGYWPGRFRYEFRSLHRQPPVAHLFPHDSGNLLLDFLPLREQFIHREEAPTTGGLGVQRRGKAVVLPPSHRRRRQLPPAHCPG